MRYRDIYASILRYCKETQDTINNMGGKVTFLVLDSQPNLEQLPAGDNFYLMAFTTQKGTEHDFIYANGFFGFKVIEDPNLTRMELLYMDYIIHEIIEKKKCIPVYNSDTGEEMGSFIFDGTFETTPVRINDSAMFKNVSFTLLTPQALNSSGNT